MEFSEFSQQEDILIEFHSEEIDFQLPDSEKMILWIKNTISKENKQLSFLNFVFCNDSYLHQINMEYLNHDTLTDIITFPLSEDPEKIEGDIFISVERVEENAKKFKVPFLQELKRVMIHGVLHLCGYKDKSATAKKEMRFKEDYYLNEE